MKDGNDFDSIAAHPMNNDVRQAGDREQSHASGPGSAGIRKIFETSSSLLYASHDVIGGVHVEFGDVISDSFQIP